MPEFIVNALPGALIALIGLLLGVVAYRRFNTKQLGEIQQQVIATYQAQSAGQKEEIATLKGEIMRCKSENKAMRIAFAKLGILIEIDIDEEIITMIKEEDMKKSTTIIQVKIKEEEKVKNKRKEQEDK